MKFAIEQVAICPPDPKAAIELLTAMGAGEFAQDVVEAVGDVHGRRSSNVAHLAFEYGLLAGKEFEVLHYAAGDNWMRHANGPRVSHFGMHCSAEELVDWRAFFSARQIPVAQEVLTVSHSNPVIAGQRWYNYVIFDTASILGVDIKFIVRRDHEPSKGELSL